MASPVFRRFQNGFNKVVIELCGVQFWSEIILVISNRTRAARSFDFEITSMISDQIALHSVQLPLYINSNTQFIIAFLKRLAVQDLNNQFINAILRGTLH